MKRPLIEFRSEVLAFCMDAGVLVRMVKSDMK